MEDATISQLRKKPYTQNIAPHYVLLTLEYKAIQIKRLIQSGINSEIKICTRVDITSPNGIETSIDFRLTPEQILKVWQVKPKLVTLFLKPPEDLAKHLPEEEVELGINRLLINKIEADFILCAAQQNLPPSQKKVVEEKVQKILSERGRHAISKSSKHQGNIKLKEEAIRLYTEKQWKSKRQASITMEDQLHSFATENRIMQLSQDRAQITIYNWILNHGKD